MGVGACCGCCVFSGSDHAVCWAAVGLPHYQPPEMFLSIGLPPGLPNFVNFRFNPYFMFVSFMYC